MGGAAADSGYADAVRTGLSPRGRGSRSGWPWSRSRPGPIPAWAGQPYRALVFCGLAKAYPRVGGAARINRSGQVDENGLSPRGRGSPIAIAIGAYRRRPIPAWAGQPRERPACRGVSRAYPRVGGAARATGYSTATVRGLSPRGRGSLAARGGQHLPAGPIPAWAGQPGSPWHVWVQVQAYPRVGGAAGTGGQHERRRGGLSPRGRGSPPAPYAVAADVRPIPAWAGQPPERPGCRAIVRAYPRVGGAAVPVVGHQPPTPGLSPRGRGSPGQAEAWCGVDGPIPAWAGQPRTPPSRLLTRRAYPRVGGAAPGLSFSESARQGLSPRGRGSLPLHQPAAGHHGPIPAWAGQPPACPSTRTPGRAYPRVGGAASKASLSGSRIRGLSPRGRGSPDGPREGLDGVGPIPAWAGQPAGRIAAARVAGAYPRVGGAA